MQFKQYVRPHIRSTLREWRKLYPASSNFTHVKKRLRHAIQSLFILTVKNAKKTALKCAENYTIDYK